MRAVIDCSGYTIVLFLELLQEVFDLMECSRLFQWLLLLHCTVVVGDDVFLVLERCLIVGRQPFRGQTAQNLHFAVVLGA